MKIFVKYILPCVLVLLAVLLGATSLYTVGEDQFACVVRFERIIGTTNTAGLHVKVPFVDSVRYFPKATQFYDIPASEVLTADKKSMTVDSYVLWRIEDALTFFQTLGTTGIAEARLNVYTYNVLKTKMGTLEQSAIINREDGGERNDIYEAITKEVSDKVKEFGIVVVDIKVKRLDLPEDNEAAVYARMISERRQMAEKYIADGERDAAKIRNDVDRQVNITVSDAEAEAAKAIADGEAEYMRMLAETYDTDEKKDFFEFTKALEALKASLDGDEKTVILGKDNKLVEILTGK